jgi:hypothetical protein
MAVQRTEPIKVYVVTPPLPRPWRTQGDYWTAQKRSRRIHAVALISIIVSTVAAVGASIGAMAAMGSLAPILPDVVRVQCVAPATPPEDVQRRPSVR